MKRKFILLASLAICAGANAEWFQIESVSSYNKVTAIRPDTPANKISIRIKNLENIEDIQVNRTKVLFSGKSAQQLAQDTLRGQLVWIENLEEDSGTYVGNIYLSYEQVIRAFAKQRMVGGQTVPPDVQKVLFSVSKTMLKDLDAQTTNETKAHNSSGNGYSLESYYEDQYLRGLFVYETLIWYKEKGQFLPEEIQMMLVTWISQYQSSQGQRASILEMKIRDLTVRYELYRDFIFDE
ncbi:MAG: hypothetical protein JXR40_14315 [Pontiellaceae bacterium]|nr:hypothetical protein [Pontiellaceae bacterium]